MIFLFLGLDIRILLNKEKNDFKGLFEIKFLNLKIFSKNFSSNDFKTPKKEKNRSKDKNFKKTNSKKNNEKQNKNKWNDIKELIILLKENLNHFLNFINTCINSIKIEKFDAEILFGFNSYVDTATTVGYIWGLFEVLNGIKPFNLSAEPIFTKETLDFKSEIFFNINLLKPVLSFLKLFKRKSMFKLLFILRRLS